MRFLRIRRGYVALLLVLGVSSAIVNADPQATGAATQQPPSATAPPAKLPPFQEILDRHTKAIGGREAILARSSAKATGTMTMPGAGLSGTVVMYAAKPDKKLARVSVPDIGEIEEGFDGKTGWSLNPMTGPSLATGKELEERKLDSEFYGLNIADRYESITTIEQTTFDGRPCYKLRLVRRGGGEDFQFYDTATGLRAGAIVTRQNPMGAITVTSVESEYKAFGGILHATKVVNTIGPVQQVISVTSVEYDNVDPSLFDPPAVIKALIK